MVRSLFFWPMVLIAVWGLAQEPPPGQVPAQPPETVEAEAQAVIEEVNEFYAGYWRAWNDRDAEAVAARVAADYVGLVYVEERGLVEMDKQAEIEGVRRFFQALGERDAAWRRRLLSVVPRTEREAVAAVRNEFRLGPGSGEVELTLEVLRKQAEGDWLLVRKYSEKSRWHGPAANR